MKGIVTIKKMFYNGKAYGRGDTIDIKDNHNDYSERVDFKGEVSSVEKKSSESKAEVYQQDDESVSSTKKKKAVKKNGFKSLL